MAAVDWNEMSPEEKRRFGLAAEEIRADRRQELHLQQEELAKAIVDIRQQRVKQLREGPKGLLGSNRFSASEWAQLLVFWNRHTDRGSAVEKFFEQAGESAIPLPASEEQLMKQKPFRPPFWTRQGSLKEWVRTVCWNRELFSLCCLVVVEPGDRLVERSYLVFNATQNPMVIYAQACWHIDNSDMPADLREEAADEKYLFGHAFCRKEGDFVVDTEMCIDPTLQEVFVVPDMGFHDGQWIWSAMHMVP